jgi:flagellar hook-associated protein 2
MAITSTGIGSNLDVESIISQLMALERKPVTALDTKESKFQAQLSAYGSVKGAMSSFQSAMSGLANVARYTSYTANSSDATIVAPGAGADAAPGNYSIEVTALAQAQKLTAAGQASTTTAIGTGASTTLIFDFGTISGGGFSSATGHYTGATFTSNGSGTKTVTIDNSNNTLTGIRDAINNAAIGVTATIVNDGSTSPYRLVITSNASGNDKSVKIASSGDATVSALLANDPAGTQNLSETIAGQNAEFKIDGLSISKSTNTVADAIPGVTLILQKTNAGSTVKINVSQDTAQLTSAVTAFVKAYNDLNKTLGDLSAYNVSTKQGAILNGDATIRSLQAQIRSTLNAAATGLTGGYATLPRVGVTLQKDGTMTVDSTKLQAAIDSSPDSIARLFAAAGTPTDSLVDYSAATSSTKPGSYAVNVTQLSTKGSVAGSAAAALTIYWGTNDALNVTLGGVTATITLSAGTYASASALATEVQNKINAATAYSSAGLSVTVSEAAGVLTIASDDYGAAAGVSITGGNAYFDLLGGAPVTTAGKDVAGTINGATATGAGLSLTGAAGDASEGLKIDITGGALGNRGTVAYTQGYAHKLNALATGFLDTAGAITSRADGINRSIKDIDNRRDALNLRLIDIEKRYRAQFTALDTMLAQMTSTSNFLTQQLANLPRTSNQ